MNTPPSTGGNAWHRKEHWYKSAEEPNRPVLDAIAVATF